MQKSGVIEMLARAVRLREILPITTHQWAAFGLLRALIRRDLESRYKGSMLGNFWPLINQLSQLFIYTYVFSIVLKVKLSLGGIAANDTVTFGLWLFAGLLPWFAFTGGLGQAAASVITNPNLVKKVVFPLGLLPLVPVLSAFIESSVGLAALIIIVAIASKTLHSTLALLPLIWIPQLLFTSGLSYLAAALTVFLRDIPQSLGVLLNLWFYGTPIIYPASEIPEPWQHLITWLNPMAPIVEFYREAILSGKIENWPQWCWASSISLVVFLLGVTVYQHLRSAFADVL